MESEAAINGAGNETKTDNLSVDRYPTGIPTTAELMKTPARSKKVSSLRADTTAAFSVGQSC